MSSAPETSNFKTQSDASLAEVCKVIHDAGYERIVFTNGCFDVLHPGHIDTLEYAYRLSGPRGAVVVGLNSDKSIKFLKGENRPVFDQIARSHILASLRFVTYVVTFDEETPIKLIEGLKPDIIVKGGDYADKEVVGKDHALVCIAPLKGEWSSSTVINRIKKL